VNGKTVMVNPVEMIHQKIYEKSALARKREIAAGLAKDNQEAFENILNRLRGRTM